MSFHCRFILALSWCFFTGCTPQKILLIGTHHRTQPNRIIEVIPIYAALEKFHPDIFCVEYPRPDDSVSLRYKYTDSVFDVGIKKRLLWNVKDEDAQAINFLNAYLKENPATPGKRIALAQRYFLSHDIVNAEYQGYLTFKNASDSILSSLSEKFKSYPLFLGRYQWHNWYNSEYQILVFPLAAKLGISYLYPVDDFTTWKLYEKYWDNMQVYDSANSFSIKNHFKQQRIKNIKTDPPIKSNMWVALNSKAFIQDLLFTEGYLIGADSVNENSKMIHVYWVLRNKMMAQHIDEIARKNRKQSVVVFFGASHVGPVREELKKLKGKRKILTLSDILPNLDSIANFAHPDFPIYRE